MGDKARHWKDQAIDLLRKGRYEKSLSLFRKVLESDPHDYSCHHTVGYILRKLGQEKDAVKVLTELANVYADQGFLLKAIATCKVILEIDPNHKTIQPRLAELYARQSTGRPPSAVKVMAEAGADVQFGAEAVVPLAVVPDDEILQEVGEIFSIEVSTPLADVRQTPRPDEELTGETKPEAEINLEVEFGGPSREEKTLPEIPLFSDLDAEAFIAVLEQIKLIRMNTGDWIIREGDPGDSMFTIACGSVRVLKRLEGERALQLAVLGEGAFFGEMAVLRGGPRGASVQAVQGGELFEISKELLDRVVDKYPSVNQVLKKFAKQRLLRNVMATSALFGPFDRDERVHIIEQFVSREVEPGEVLITEGQESNGFYLILRGKMEVRCEMDDGNTIVVGELAEGEVFGEISCLHQEPAMATVRVATPGVVLRLSRQDFHSLILSHPQILELVSELSEKRRALTVNTLAKRGILI